MHGLETKVLRSVFFSYLGGAFLAAPHGDCDLLYSAMLEVISCLSRKNVILERLSLPGCVITAFAQTGALRASSRFFEVSLLFKGHARRSLTSPVTSFSCPVLSLSLCHTPGKENTFRGGTCCPSMSKSNLF